MTTNRSPWDSGMCPLRIKRDCSAHTSCASSELSAQRISKRGSKRRGYYYESRENCAFRLQDWCLPIIPLHIGLVQLQLMPIRDWFRHRVRLHSFTSVDIIAAYSIHYFDTRGPKQFDNKSISGFDIVGNLIN